MYYPIGLRYVAAYVVVLFPVSTVCDCPKLVVLAFIP